MTLRCLSLVALAWLSLVAADEYAHRYTEAEAVHLWINKVGPYHNPQETYVYYSLPFCSSKPVAELEHRWDYLGEVLEGNDLISSGLAMQFRTPVRDHSKICSMTLTDDTVQQFQYAVRNHYWCTQPKNSREQGQLWSPPLALVRPVRTRARTLPCSPRRYQLYMDDLPIWGMVGELTTTDMDEGGELEGEALVYTHKRFSVSYNGDRIIQVCREPRRPRNERAGSRAGATTCVLTAPVTPLTR